jgi:predicted dehydrogenase
MLDRRSFISHSAVIAAATAALRDASVFAQDPAPPTHPVGANDKLRVAVVGTGGRGGNHISAFNGNHGCEITVVCDADSARVGPHIAAIEKKTGKKARFEQDVRKVMEDKSIDIVSFATPNHWHALGTVWALQAGKHVYCEKPASHNVIEGRRMIEAARKYNRICQIGTQSRSNKGMQEAIQYIHDGKIGKVSLAYGTCYKRRNSIGKTAAEQQVPATVDYDLWCGPAPMLALKRKSLHYDWHWFYAYGNGDLGNQGVHEMDKARWGLNKDTMPKSVVSVGGRLGYEDDGETANTQLCVFDYGDCEMVFEVRGLPSISPFPGPMANGKVGSNFVGNIWYGDKGIVVCPSYDSGVVLSPDLQQVTSFKGGGDHFANFVAAVRKGSHAELKCDVAEGHLSAALCHLANISYLCGTKKSLNEVKEIAGSKEANSALTRMVQHLTDNKVDGKDPVLVGPLLPLDAKTERFTGNNEKANTMLGREYRKGYELPKV